MNNEPMSNEQCAQALEQMRKQCPGNGAQHDIMREAVTRACEALTQPAVQTTTFPEES